MISALWLIGRFLEWLTFFAFGLAFGLYWEAMNERRRE